MANKLSNVQVLLDELIREKNEEYDYKNINDFFEFYSASQYLKSYDLSDEEIDNCITGNGGDGGCDSIFLIIDDTLIKVDSKLKSDQRAEISIQFYIIQSKNSYTFGEDVISKWKDVSKNLLVFDSNIDNYKKRYNDKVREVFTLFLKCFKKLIAKKPQITIHYVYISKGDANNIHPNVKQASEELIHNVKELFPYNGFNCDVEFIGAEELINIAMSEVKKEYELSLIEKPINLDGTKDYICLVNIYQYYQFITNNNDIIRSIFDSNVRDYQGDVTVNTEIQKSLLDNKDEFWWLNNGVTIISTNTFLLTSQQIQIVDPKIINGLQTSTEIYNYVSKNIDAVKSDKRNILVRVIVPQDEETRDRIIKANNNQTKIPKASLRSTDLVHRQIEQYFASRNLYYDRRKNYYKNQGKKPYEIISIQFLGQCLMSVLLQKPNYARARPSTILSDDDDYNSIYCDISLETYYRIAKIGKSTLFYLKKKTSYSAAVRGDIQFYIIYSIVVLMANTANINNDVILGLDMSSFNEQIIKDTTDHVHSLYISLGGTNDVAKGSVLISKLKDQLKHITG